MTTTDCKTNETHLGFIQSVITRMGQNSFQAKAWCITVVSALNAYLVNQECPSVHMTCSVISIVVTVLFCVLDTYYLYLERGYRKLYMICAGLVEGKSVKAYDMEIPKEYRGFSQYMKALASVSTGAFYIVIEVGLVAILLFVQGG